MDGFSQKIHGWFKKNKRDLPWRNTRNPYKIWISEIILQQTRVDQGTSYYLNFINRFPTVNELANAREDEVLKLWQGLGYYSRARHLHGTAKYICKKYNGNFPGNYDEILSLKGIGPYTAAAIASIAFGLPCPALDGNVYRVLARHFGIFESPASGRGKKVFQKVAEKIIPPGNPGFHNQAFMEFGALQCVPKSPDCPACPVAGSCYAFQKKQVGSLPVKSPKLKQRTRYFYFYFIESGKYTWLEKRIGNDIWKNLFQFPLIETEKELTGEEIAKQNPHFLNGHELNVKFISEPQKHILSHQIIFARLIHLETFTNCVLKGNFIKIPAKNIHTFAVPRLVEKMMAQTGCL